MPAPREVHISGYTEKAQNSMLYATVIIGDSSPHYKSEKIWSIPSNGDTEPKIIPPHGIGLDKEYNVLVADQGGDQVLCFTADGKFLDEIGDSPERSLVNLGTERSTKRLSWKYLCNG